MAHFDDLSQCTYFGQRYLAPGVKLLAVGWLAKDQPFAQGDVDRAAYEWLAALDFRAWQPGRFMGVHACELCASNAPYCVDNYFIPGRDCVYVSPKMIVHYIADHGYRPPDEFIEAVLECPPMNSREYFEAITRHWLEPARAHNAQEVAPVCPRHGIPKSWSGCRECMEEKVDETPHPLPARLEASEKGVRAIPPWLLLVGMLLLALRLSTCH